MWIVGVSRPDGHAASRWRMRLRHPGVSLARPLWRRPALSVVGHRRHSGSVTTTRSPAAAPGRDRRDINDALILDRRSVLRPRSVGSSDMAAAWASVRECHPRARAIVVAHYGAPAGRGSLKPSPRVSHPNRTYQRRRSAWHHRRNRNRDPPVPGRHSRRGARRPAPPHRGDALASARSSSKIGRRACSWRRFRRSPATGRPTTTGARPRRG